MLRANSSLFSAIQLVDIFVRHTRKNVKPCLQENRELSKNKLSELKD
jgi:hypothetical protein